MVPNNFRSACVCLIAACFALSACQAQDGAQHFASSIATQDDSNLDAAGDGTNNRLPVIAPEHIVPMFVKYFDQVSERYEPYNACYFGGMAAVASMLNIDFAEQEASTAIAIKKLIGSIKKYFASELFWSALSLPPETSARMLAAGSLAFIFGGACHLHREPLLPALSDNQSEPTDTEKASAGKSKVSACEVGKKACLQLAKQDLSKYSEVSANNDDGIAALTAKAITTMQTEAVSVCEYAFTQCALANRT